MKEHSLKSLFCAMLLLGQFFFVPTGHALDISKTPRHYADEMEFFYQKPRPEIIPDLFRSFYRHGILADPEKRLFLAAFLAELARNGQVPLARLQNEAADLGKDAIHTVAWSLHLAQIPEESEILQQFLGEDALVLLSQIKRTPAPLSAWQMREKAVLQMYWAAFMATGNNFYLDKIIDAALRYGHLKACGQWGGEAYQVGAAAASSLYELSRRHPKVRQRLEARLLAANASDRQTIGLMLGE